MNTKNEISEGVKAHLKFADIHCLDEACFQKMDMDSITSFKNFPKIEDNQVFFFTRSYHHIFEKLVAAFSLAGVQKGETSSFEPARYTNVRAGQFGFINGHLILSDTFASIHVQMGPTLSGFYIVTVPERSLYADAPVARPTPVTDKPFFVHADVVSDTRDDGLGEASDWAEDTSYTPQQVAIMNFERLVDEEYKNLYQSMNGDPASFQQIDNRVRDYIKDAIRYRALKEQRVRYLGSAGLHNEHIKDNGYAHIGLELWTMTGEVPESMREDLEKSHAMATEMLDVYTAISAVTNSDRLGLLPKFEG